jgi:hypothetical protein
MSDNGIVRLLNRQRMRNTDSLGTKIRGPVFEQPELTDVRIRQDEQFAKHRRMPMSFCPHGKLYEFAGTQLGCRRCPR